MKHYKVGLIGYGFSGRIFHAPFISEHPQLELFAIASSQRQAIAADHPTALQLSTEEIIQHPDIDIVVIATPNDSHASLAIQVIQANKHVVIEKPVALNNSECQQLLSLQKTTDKAIAVYHNRRWDSDFLSIKKLLEKQSLGKLHTYKAHFHRFRPEVKIRWREQAVAGSGTLFDLGAHLIDQALCLFGMPQSLAARLEQQRQGAETTDYFDLQLHYPNLNVQLSSSSLTLVPGPRFELHGDKGSYFKSGMDPQESQLLNGLDLNDASFGQDNNDSVLYLNQSSSQALALEQGNYLGFYNNLVGHIAQGAALEVTLEQAVNVIQVIEMSTLSHQQQRTISLDEYSRLIN